MIYVLKADRGQLVTLAFKLHTRHFAHLTSIVL